MLLGVSELSADAGLPGGIVRLINGDVVFLLHSLDELLNEFVQLTFGLHLLQLLAHLLVEQFAFQQCLLEHAAQFLQGLLALLQFIPAVVLKSALQKVV